ncbi:MAG TPA: hypothetical protein VLM76_06620 [Patescibacteria group bacterium]|nr:hypothetical protein [Patescibacteria group bacterium]
MSGLQRATRHPDRINDPHVRARGLASDALLGPLDAADAAWYDGHLADCEPCAAAATAFADDAALLRGLRTDLPPAPRDLGARVSLALDDEVRRARRGRRAAGLFGRRASGPATRPPGFAFVGVVAVAVVALLATPIVVQLGAPPAGTPPAGNLLPVPTPIVVDSQPVAWVRRMPDGTYVLSSADVQRVCAGVDATACGTLDGGAQTLATFAVQPSSVLLPRDGRPAVIVSANAVYAVAVNLAPPVTTPVPEPSPGETSEPVQSPAAPGEPAPPPVGSPAPSDLPVSPAPTTPSPDPGAPTPPSTLPPSASPDPGVTEPATTVPAPPLPTIPPAPPAPTPAPALTIAEGVILVGAPPAYSPDGQWVAFSARPADGSRGPDIYAWHVGELRARILTNDHASVFSGWVHDAIVASTARAVEDAVPGAPSEVPGAPSETPADAPAPPSVVPGPTISPAPPPVVPDPNTSPAPDASPDPALTPATDASLEASPAPRSLPGTVPAADADPATVVARSYLIDPGGTEVTAIARDGIWRPVVDPTDRVVVFWTGSLAWSATDQAWMPAQGDLVLAEWQAVLGRADPPPVAADPNATPHPDATPPPDAPPPDPTPLPDETAEPIVTPSPTPVVIAVPDRALPAGAAGTDVADWEVRFDPSGRRLGVWVADPAEPGTGRLALVAVESDGSLGAVLLADAAALPGFSMEDDRLAWSTPPGRNGRGSLVTVFAWRGDHAGQLYGMPDPGDEPIVVVR